MLCCISSPAFADGDGYGGLFDGPGAATAVPIASPDAVPSQVVVQPVASTVPAVQPAAQPATAQAPALPMAPTTPVTTWAAPGAPSGGAWGSGGSTDAGRLLPTGASDGYCDPEIAKLDEKLRAQEVDGRTSLARQSFSLLPAGFSSLSCIDKLLNSTINIFGPGSLQNLLSSILNSFSCQRVLSMVNSYANQQISQYTSQAAGMVSGSLSGLPIGSAIPGVSLGSLTAGAVNLSPTINIGGAGSNYVNLGQAWNNNPGGGGPTLPSRLFGQ